MLLAWHDDHVSPTAGSCLQQGYHGGRRERLCDDVVAVAPGHQDWGVRPLCSLSAVRAHQRRRQGHAAAQGSMAVVPERQFECHLVQTSGAWMCEPPFKGIWR